tara:strand:- start:114 stop:383 length:270 start_codon:yes stop_codon:yes gene_type:complete
MTALKEGNNQMNNFLAAIQAQTNLRETYIHERLLAVQHPNFPISRKHEIYQLQRSGAGVTQIAQKIGVERHEIHKLLGRTSWPHPATLT